MFREIQDGMIGLRALVRGATVAFFCAAAMIAVGGLREQTPYQYFRVANPSVPHPAHVRAGFALMGGGKDLDDAFAWLCDGSGGGEFLILRATGDDAYNPYMNQLCKVSAVATLVIPNRQAAESPFVAQKIREASAIFVSGGDQANYIKYWSDTPVQKGLNDAIARGVPFGGTSAGLAIQGEFAYTAQKDPADGPDLSSRETLADPFFFRVTIVRDFLKIPALARTITDTHFSARDRLGRLLTFMARILDSGDAGTVRGIGVDERTAVLLNPDGEARVVGKGAVYFLSAAVKPSVCKKGEPLAFDGVAVRRLRANAKFDLQKWEGDGDSYSLSVHSGTIISSQAGGSPY
ncbi:MAG TPA: cyanophycinase [Candidatus Acidoferrales bacterium]